MELDSLFQSKLSKDQHRQRWSVTCSIHPSKSLKSFPFHSTPCQSPNRSPSPNTLYGHAFQSHPHLYTSVPHQLNPSIHPGYKTPKNTVNTANANPLSSAALIVIVYLPHHAPLRRRIKLLNTKHTTAHTLKFRPVAGGIQDSEPKRMGKLILRHSVVRCLWRFMRRRAIR